MVLPCYKTEIVMHNTIFIITPDNFSLGNKTTG